MLMSVKQTVTSSEVLSPEIDKMIEGAKQAVQYFKWMLDAQKATEKLVESQYEYAKEQLQKLEEEKTTKYGERPN